MLPGEQLRDAQWVARRAAGQNRSPREPRSTSVTRACVGARGARVCRRSRFGVDDSHPGARAAGRPRCFDRSDGAIFDASSDLWSPMPRAPIAGRVAPAAAWTGTELLVWEGLAPKELADGAAFNPSTGTWRRLPRSPFSARIPAASVWTGSKLIVWGTGHERCEPSTAPYTSPGRTAVSAPRQPSGLPRRPLAAGPTSTRRDLA